MGSAVFGLLLLFSSGSCGLLDVDITLATQTFMKSFGNTKGSVQSAPCTSQTDTCTAAAGPVNNAVAGSGATVSGVCDLATQTCQAELDVTFAAPLNLSQDQAFINGVAGKAVNIVKRITLKYGVPTNTTTFAIPELKLYLAPQGITSVADMTKVTYVDKISALSRGQTLPADAGRISIAENSPAFAKLVYYIQHPSEPFSVLLNTKTLVKAGEPMPAGDILVRVTPEITVGF